MMEYITLSNSDLKVSPICVGCWQFNGDQQSADKTWDAQPEQVSKDIVDKAIQLGVNFFDTAEGYLNSEAVLGRILQGKRRDVVVATKFGVRVPKYTATDIEQSITNSLAKLQTDYIDLYQVHWPVFLSDYKECFDELNRQQAKGRIRHYAVCNFGPQNLKDALEVGAKPISNQLSYSLLWRPIEYEVMPLCKENNIGILAYSPLQQGLLSGKYTQLEDVPEGRRRTRLFNAESTSLSKHGEAGAEKQMFDAISAVAAVCDKSNLEMPAAALSWCLEQQPVQAVIVGARNPQQIEKNAKIVKIQQDVLKELSEATQELKEIFGNNPDMWAKDSRIE
jgi:myo-inositol catabolism protein IolS